MNPVFFRTPAELRTWFSAHHAKEREVQVGFYKKGSGEPGITWAQAVDEALCVGWIDGVRSSGSKRAYVIRFTPRRTGSIWSAVNIRRVEALSAEGRMRPMGLAVFAARREDRSGVYSYEQRNFDLTEPYQRLLKENVTAWAFFQSQPPSYRKKAHWWVISAKQETTRLRRLEKIIGVSARGQRL